jgi:UDP-glucose:(heptosyl)LPS alpha-1,3-glucosyltransferase
MKSVCFVRKSFRFDGGAEAAAASYLLVLKKFFSVSILCESWSGGVNDLKLVKLPKAGFFRSAKYKNFISQASKIITKNDCISHSHELVPGANIIRLGDGLHSVWLDIRGVSSVWRWVDGFHRAKLAFEKKALTHPNLKHIITISDQTKSALIKRYSIPPEKITTIRNIVTKQYMAHEPNEELRSSSKMLYVGSGFWRKGLSYAIQALALIPNQWTLDVVGKDKEQKKYIRLAKRLGVMNRVNFFGCFSSDPGGIC